MIGARFLVRGRVQGVGFRWFVSRQARELGICGSVQNLIDGTVEVVAWADRAEPLARLEGLLGQGPDHAAVESVNREDLPGDGDATPRRFVIQ